jgi:hypothetical protein
MSFRTSTGSALGSVALAALTLGSFAGTAFAADSLTGLRSCVKQADDAQRLSCFDREMARLPAVVQPAQPAAAAAPVAQPSHAVAAAAPAAPAQSAEEKFGYRGAIARKDVDARAAETGAVGELTAVVAKIVTRTHGEMIITLDNGQVWAQKAPEAYFHLKQDEKVIIKPGLLNSFTLVNAAGRSTKVTRQQ